MPITRRERKKERTRNDLIACAVSLFRDKGFTETSIEEIAERADVSRGTLYNHFPDKDSILVAYFQKKIADASEEFRRRLGRQRKLESRLAVLLDFMFQVLSDDLSLATIYFRYRLSDLGNPTNQPQRSGMGGLVLEIIREAQRGGEIRADLPSEVIAGNIQFMFMNFLIVDAQVRTPTDVALHKRQLIELFLNGARA